jgi:TetR/AcrR family transcriptional regulator, mexJK operon transcriptional repressor
MSEEAQDSGRLQPEKRQRILDAAVSVFTELGFERASVDLISARACVSKATVYNHFQDKKALFVSCVLGQAGEMQATVSDLVATTSGDLEADLRSLGERLLRFMLSPASIAFQRAIAAEVIRFPELGRALYACAATPFRDFLARFFRERQSRGELEIDDPGLVAMQFMSLCKGELMVRVQLGMVPDVGEPEIQSTVGEAVKLLLRAYRPRG